MIITLLLYFKFLPMSGSLLFVMLGSPLTRHDFIPGLSVHLNQVHKETLEQVENALPNRQGLDVEIFGMEGVPAEVLESHRSRLIQNFYQAQEDRRLATGNPLPGQSQNTRKKITIETAEELKARLAEWREKRKNGGAMEDVVATTVSIFYVVGLRKCLLSGQADDLFTNAFDEF
jgi:hypothetical protein